jgi:hypothetical protein
LNPRHRRDRLRPPLTDDEVAELVVIFPTNVWEYDVLDFFPFTTPEAKAMAEKARQEKARSQGK